MPDARLVLADGSVFEGSSIGAPGHADGEVVFNTSMTGYQEMLTDPSYAGQLLTLTYPIIGNYGIDVAVDESSRIQPTGLIVREAAVSPSHLLSTGTVSSYLRERGVVGIEGVDTRAITRRIRQHGVKPGTVTTHEPADAALERLRSMPDYDNVNWVSTVTTNEAYDWDNSTGKHRVALLDRRGQPFAVGRQVDRLGRIAERHPPDLGLLRGVDHDQCVGGLVADVQARAVAGDRDAARPARELPRVDHGVGRHVDHGEARRALVRDVGERGGRGLAGPGEAQRQQRREESAHCASDAVRRTTVELC